MALEAVLGFAFAVEVAKDRRSAGRPIQLADHEPAEEIEVKRERNGGDVGAPTTAKRTVEIFGGYAPVKVHLCVNACHSAKEAVQSLVIAQNLIEVEPETAPRMVMGELRKNVDCGADPRSFGGVRAKILDQQMCPNFRTARPEAATTETDEFRRHAVGAYRSVGHGASQAIIGLRISPACTSTPTLWCRISRHAAVE